MKSRGCLARPFAQLSGRKLKECAQEAILEGRDPLEVAWERTFIASPKLESGRDGCTTSTEGFRGAGGRRVARRVNQRPAASQAKESRRPPVKVALGPASFHVATRSSLAPCKPYCDQHGGGPNGPSAAPQHVELPVTVAAGATAGE